MKYTINIFVLIMISAITLFAQSDNNSDKVKSSINKLFELCKNSDFEQAATFIAYTGKDTNRQLKDSYNYKDAKEASKVKRIAKKIKAFLDISDKFTFGVLKTENIDNKLNYTVEVLFISGSQELKTLFTFVESGDKLLMTDLN